MFIFFAASVDTRKYKHVICLAWNEMSFGEVNRVNVPNDGCKLQHAATRCNLDNINFHSLNEVHRFNGK